MLGIHGMPGLKLCFRSLQNHTVPVPFQKTCPRLNQTPIIHDFKGISDYVYQKFHVHSCPLLHFVCQKNSKSKMNLKITCRIEKDFAETCTENK